MNHIRFGDNNKIGLIITYGRRLPFDVRWFKYYLALQFSFRWYDIKTYTLKMWLFQICLFELPFINFRFHSRNVIDDFFREDESGKIKEILDIFRPIK